MAKFMVAPREGHLAAVVRIFAYIKKHLRSRIVFDPTERNFSNHGQIEADWKEFYPDAAEAIPGNAPEPRGQPIFSLICSAMQLMQHVWKQEDLLQVLLFLEAEHLYRGIQSVKIQLKQVHLDQSLQH